MPQLIRTPEDIFRAEAKDLYFIAIKDDKGQESPAWGEIQEWLKTHLPDARVEMMAPSEQSGWISGYFGELRVDFSEADLAAFCAHWENADGGSLDPRFQCYVMPYQPWFERISQYAPAIEQPAEPGLTRWWDTPIGFVYHQISLEEAAQMELERHPVNARDLWFNFSRLMPELASLDPSKLTHGDICKRSDGRWIVVYSTDVFSEQDRFSTERQSELRNWFRLPADTEMCEDEW